MHKDSTRLKMLVDHSVYAKKMCCIAYKKYNLRITNLTIAIACSHIYSKDTKQTYKLKIYP